MRLSRTLPLASVLAPLAAGIPASDGAPNLLLILTDQHNPRALGIADDAFGGLTEPLTPSLDALAAGGVHVPRAWCTTPQCMPSRFSMLTGRWPHEHGLRFNGIWERPVGETTLADLARRAGYATATIGKHHLRWLDQDGVQATDHGFDLVLDYGDYRQYCEDHGVEHHRHPSRVHLVPGLPEEVGMVGYTDNPNRFHPSGYFSDRAMDFLEARAPAAGGDGQPFALWLSFPGPHAPILPSGPASALDFAHRHFPYEDLDLPPNVVKEPSTNRLSKKVEDFEAMSRDQHRQVLAYYYGYVGQIDHNVGRVLDRLEELDIAQDTVVVFTADHGEYASEMRVWAKGGGMYDCLTRVPLVLRAPGFLPAGGDAQTLFSHVDLAPTLSELLALSPTPAERARWAGVSLVEDLRTGLPVPGRRPHVFSSFGIAPADKLLRMVVTRTDKLVVDTRPRAHPEYYDLAQDPWEIHDLHGDPALESREDELRVRIGEWWGSPTQHAPLYGEAGSEEQPPCPASDPDPAPGMLGVGRDVDPRWLPSTAAARQEVWAAVAGGPLELVAVLGPLADRWNAGNLPPHTLVRWRVDGINGNGRSVGAVWMFGTGEGPDGPGIASAPRPRDGAGDVDRQAALRWTPAAGASRQEVWLARGEGPWMPLALDLAAEADHLAPPGGLAAGERYRWRVDGRSAKGATEGTVWSFEVDPAGLPGHAWDPQPAHLDQDVFVAPGSKLRWQPGAGAVQHAVYFGPSFPLTLQTVTDDARWTLGALAPDTVYYWRVDEVNAAGTRRGRTWRFTTSP